MPEIDLKTIFVSKLPIQKDSQGSLRASISVQWRVRFGELGAFETTPEPQTLHPSILLIAYGGLSAGSLAGSLDPDFENSSHFGSESNEQACTLRGIVSSQG